MKLFGLFGKSSNDDKDTATEESATPVSSEEHIAPPEEPSSQSQEAVDRGGTMSEVIKAVTDQFALINADSDADLRAVGAALCQIPEGMAPLSEGFASFRHEVLHAILMTGDEAGMADRAVVLNNCLAAIEDTPDLAEQSISLRIIAEELRDTMLSAHREAPGQGSIAEPAAALSADEVTPERNEPSNQEGISTTEPDPAGAPFVAASFEAPSTVTLEEEQQEGLEPSAADAPAFEVIEGARAAKAPLEAVSPASFAAEA